MNMEKIGAFIVVVVVLLWGTSCDDGKINVFSVDKDIELGEQVTQEVLNNPDEYPVLDKDQYSEVYERLEDIRDQLLASGEIRYADRFDWEIYIIDKEVLNAFAVPGGNTFYYTGLIKFLDDEASLAGVMAHEFAHADRRHSTNRMTKMYGVQTLISMALGEDPAMIEEVLGQLGGSLTGLAFSRGDEYEADKYAVRYLYETDWDSRGVAYFFEKIGPQEGAEWMKYFQTHPNPSDRIDRIYEHHESLGGKEGNTYPERYEELKNSLP